MTKHMRPQDLIRRFLNKRPDGESYTEYSRRLGLAFNLTFSWLGKRKDINVGLLYRVLKEKGYLLMAYNPNAPEGMDKYYIIDNTYAPVKEREKKKGVTYRRDPYTNELLKKKRRYRKDEYTKFKRIG